jgi:hypothetical protein
MVRGNEPDVAVGVAEVGVGAAGVAVGGIGVVVGGRGAAVGGRGVAAGPQAAKPAVTSAVRIKSNRIGCFIGYRTLLMRR